jgi:hypothetical protein
VQVGFVLFQVEKSRKNRGSNLGTLAFSATLVTNNTNGISPHQHFYLKFCVDSGLATLLNVPPNHPQHPDKAMFLMDQPRERCYTQLSLYCLHLALGHHTLFCKSIKAKTVKKYLVDAADMIAPLCCFDPCWTESSTSKNAPPLQAIITEIKRWESVSDKRREPFTPAIMLTHLGHLATLERSKYKDNELLAVLFDFFLCGLYVGFRQSD